MIDRLNDIESRYEFLKSELMNPDILNDLKKITDISKEQSNLDMNF
jgi:peptide chain release factor 1